jgi:hypothetical protein
VYTPGLEPVTVGEALIVATAVPVTLAVSDTRFTAGAVEKTGSILTANVVSLAKVSDVKGSMEFDIAPANATRSDAGASASRADLSNVVRGLRTLQM